MVTEHVNHNSSQFHRRKCDSEETGIWIESPRHGGESQNETFLPQTITPEKRTRFKEIHLGIVKAEENAEQLTDAFSSSCPKLSKGEVGKDFSSASVGKSPDKHSTNVVAKDDDKSSEQEATITLRSTKQPIPLKTQRRKPTKPAKNSNEDGSGVANDGNSTLFPKQLKMFQNDNKLPEELLKNLIHSLNSDETASNTSRFLARMLSTDEYDNLDKPSSLVPFQFENAAEVHLLSDVKKRQRYEAQRLRIMRTFVLAYDSVWFCAGMIVFGTKGLKRLVLQLSAINRHKQENLIVNISL